MKIITIYQRLKDAQKMLNKIIGEEREKIHNSSEPYNITVSSDLLKSLLESVNATVKEMEGD